MLRFITGANSSAVLRAELEGLVADAREQLSNPLSPARSHHLHNIQQNGIDFVICQLMGAMRIGQPPWGDLVDHGAMYNLIYGENVSTSAQEPTPESRAAVQKMVDRLSRPTIVLEGGGNWQRRMHQIKPRVESFLQGIGLQNDPRLDRMERADAWVTFQNRGMRRLEMSRITSIYQEGSPDTLDLQRVLATVRHESGVRTYSNVMHVRAALRMEVSA